MFVQVRLDPDLDETGYTFAPTVTNSKGSRFRFSSSFQILSDEGLKVVREIVAREENRAVASARGSKRALRGLYYSSPFIRTMQSCPEILDHFAKIVGQPLVPHSCFSNSPQVNFSSPGALA